MIEAHTERAQRWLGKTGGGGGGGKVKKREG